ncbi:MAG: (d)CMP kinase [Chloroflexi bacterium]|nr:(d)CMP kinase [Chloroflexota bacterium]
MKLNVIAIDGPAASGKSTIGHMLAEKLGFLFLDTGCMYRAATLAALQQGVDVADETAVTNLSRAIQMEIKPAGDVGDGRQYTVLLNGQDITWELRSPDVDANVSLVSSYKDVREDLVRRQREFGLRGQVVMVGRDIGTVVLPDAPLKLYITASAEERARRRWLDRQEQGHNNSYDAILADVQRRDEFDSNRRHSPLQPANDAVIIDTTDLTPDAIIAEILALAQI